MAGKIDNISRKEVAEIIEARMDELFDLVEKELKKITKQALFPGGVIIVGGGAQMNGVVEFAKKPLKLPHMWVFPSMLTNWWTNLRPRSMLPRSGYVFGV